ncbi:hypothetical protein [Sinorhizobium meliloti]|uniref:hypothetical protein n=1 Tax=Rhizobium meliloti TaxID=382 RepID=UPI000FD7370A|nr:hypothetical protein [Sinorhizobium meliloti]RVK27324.1 hypothetical protein CN163_30890 [Sinorhizobium meliloti]
MSEVFGIYPKSVVTAVGGEELLETLILGGREGEMQEFPDDWEFAGGVQSVADQIGNAVPSTMAAAMGLALVVSALKGVTWRWDAVLWPEGGPREPVEAPSLSPEHLTIAHSLEHAE